jgi:phosphoribosylformylglycinamidine cyclo-ligase
MRLKPSSYVPELGNSVGEELLKVHVSYGPLIQKLLKKFNVAQTSRLYSKQGGRRDACPTIKGIAHITGGGFVDNIPRVLPKTCDVVIHKSSWEMPPIFVLIRRRGGVPDAELYQVFNMGIGMTLCVAAARANEMLGFIRAQRQAAWRIGEVVKGRGVVRFTG